MLLSDPAQRLPVEIMDRIFAFTQLVDLLGPWFLGAVCRSWRTIAWSSPELWTYLYIQLGCLKKRRPLIIDITSQWLARSGTLPLSVQIEGSRWDDNLTDGLSPLFDLLGEYVGRCQVLILNGVKVDDITRVFNKIDNQTFREIDSNLEHMELVFPNTTQFERRRNELEPHLLDLSRYDRLSKVELAGVFPSHFRTNWSKLTEASLWLNSHLVLEEFIGLLEAAPRLVRCKVRGLGGYAGQGFPRFHSSHRLVHKHLDYLRLVIDYQYPRTIETLFSAITLPSLTDLDLKSFGDDLYFSGNVMTSFIERSGCVLRGLRADFCPINSENEEDFNRFLQASPHITTLGLLSVTDCFFNRLAIRPEDCGDDLPFLPSLGEFQYLGGRTFSWQAFEQSLWRFEAKAKVVDRPIYMSLRSEFEILEESLTRRLAILNVDVHCRRRNLITASLDHWDGNVEQIVDEDEEEDT